MDGPFTINISNDILTVRFYQEPSKEDIHKALIEISEKHTITKRLWDFSEVKFDLSQDQLKDIANLAKNLFSQPSKVAMVASKDLSFGVSRIYEVFREDNRTEVKVFRNVEDARRWLMNDSTDR